MHPVAGVVFAPPLFVDPLPLLLARPLQPLHPPHVPDPRGLRLVVAPFLVLLRVPPVPPPVATLLRGRRKLLAMGPGPARKVGPRNRPPLRLVAGRVLPHFVPTNALPFVRLVRPRRARRVAPLPVQGGQKVVLPRVLCVALGPLLPPVLVAVLRLYGRAPMLAAWLPLVGVPRRVRTARDGPLQGLVAPPPPLPHRLVRLLVVALGPLLVPDLLPVPLAVRRAYAIVGKVPPRATHGPAPSPGPHNEWRCART